jgi:hypothetical protein
MLVILSRDPHPVQGSTIERSCVLCRTAYNGDPHAVQTSAVQNSAEPANAEGIPSRLDSPALPAQPEPPMYVPGPFCSEPLVC